jgi:signal transduction histidine kinase
MPDDSLEYFGGKAGTPRGDKESSIADAHHADLFQYERLLTSLSGLASEVGTARELIAVFRALRDFTIASVPCSMMFISLYDPGRGVREGVYLWHQGTELDVEEVGPVPVGGGPTGEAIRTEMPVVCNDYLKAIEGRRTIAAGFDEDPRMPRSALITPMAVMGRIVGTVEVQSLDLGAYTAEHVISMRMAASLAGVAIENVRLIERERSQQEHMRQAQKMEAIGRLAGGVAHDFNNLLTVINGYSEILLKSLPPDSSVRTVLEQIGRAGIRGASLTRQLLAFSRQQMLQPVFLDLNVAVAEMDRMLRRLIGDDIELVTLLRGAGRVKADPGQIEQLIMNLAVNARDAMPDGGTLIIETANSRLTGTPTGPLFGGEYVVLTVTDTGCGMNEETMSHIFEPFFTTKLEGKGTGLGLATVYGIVKQSHGHVSVESVPGKGTSFRICFPLSGEAREHTPAPRPAARPGAGSETVMLVEDQEMVRRLAREILQMNGYTVLEAHNGRDALDMLEKQNGSIDLLLTDVVMPQMNGRQLAQHLKQRLPGLKVLFMSGYIDDPVAFQDALDSTSALLEKPFTPEALACKVRELLDRS